MKKFALVIILAGALAYIPSFRGLFVMDDFRSINAEALDTVKDALTKGYYPLTHGRPVLMLSLWANFKISGTDIWSYHAVNLLIHLLAALVLFGVIRRTLLLADYAEGESKWLAMLCSTLWVVHPLNTQAVTYIVQRGESLMGLLFLFTLYCLIRGVLGTSRLWLLVGIIACALGMGAKEVMVVCPLVVLLYDRTFLGGAKRTFLGALRKRWLFYLALFSTCAWPLYIATIVKPQNYGATSNVWAYAASQPAAILHYLRLAFWPVGQCFDMAWPLAPLRLTSIIIFAALALTVFELIKRPMLGFLGAWFFGILAITSSFFPTGDVIFEHRMYLPLSAVIVTVVLGAYWLWQHFALQLIPTTEAQWRLLGYETAIAAVLVLGLLTWRRNGIYSDEVALWQDCVAGNVTNARARANLGLAYMHFSRFAEAAVELREALKCSPNYSYALQNLGTTLVFMHKATPWEWTITAISGGDISYTGTYSTGTTGAYTYWTLTGSGTLTITSIP